MKKWVYIYGRKNGDDFSEVCNSREEAEKKANSTFEHMTALEKEKCYLCIAEMEMDDDGYPDWMKGYTADKVWLE